MNIYIYIYACVYLVLYIGMCLKKRYDDYMYVYSDMYICMRLYAYGYIYIHIYIYMCKKETGIKRCVPLYVYKLQTYI
jgi:hypothetical protein